MTPRLTARIKTFSYPDGTVALRDLNLDIMSGDFCGILGANGSGKTTLLKLLDGLAKSSEGQVMLDGADICRLSPRQIYSRMGLVFQNPDEQLFAHSVFEDVAFGPRNMGFSEPEVESRVRSSLDAVGMAGKEQRDIHSLSYGQKKRVCIAGLLAMGHEILLLDEPTAGLDPAGELAMLDLLSKLNGDNGVTIVMATHAVDIAPLYFNRIHLLDNGSLVQSGSPSEVLASRDTLVSLKLRLPYVSELFFRLASGSLVTPGNLPLTVEEGERKILEIFTQIKTHSD